MDSLKKMRQFNKKNRNYLCEFIGNGGGSAAKRSCNSPTSLESRANTSSTTTNGERGAGPGDAGCGKQSDVCGSKSAILADNDDSTAGATTLPSNCFKPEEGDTIPYKEASENSVDEGVEEADEPE